MEYSTSVRLEKASLQKGPVPFLPYARSKQNTSAANCMSFHHFPYITDAHIFPHPQPPFKYTNKASAVCKIYKR